MNIEYEYLPDQGNIEGDFWAINIDTDTSEVTISFWPDSNKDVSWGQIDRLYDIPHEIIDVKFNHGYTYLTLDNGEMYQFKFEDAGCLVGDIFTQEEGIPIDEWEFKDSFACHDFYNDSN